MKTVLRTYSILDSLQPQFASFLATVEQGYLPVEGQASILIEIAPAIEINRITDVALKAARVTPGLQIVERLYGLLELHGDSIGEVRRAGEAVLEALGLSENERIRPTIRTSQIIRNLDDHHTMLVNRSRHGNMITRGQSLYILEVSPAGYSSFAANEAEKASNANILEVVSFGAYGRVWLGGEERDIVVAARAAEEAIASITGIPEPEDARRD